MRVEVTSAMALIMRHTRVSRQHLTPELTLRLITPECDVWSARPEEVPFISDPYWGFYWPGGQAITRYLLDEGISLRHRSVVDVGSGCGAAAIAAAKMQAARVVANDIDPSKYLLDEGISLRHRSVVDVGSGCGAAAIAAAKMQAARVVANDIDPNALIAIKINAEYNNINTIKTSQESYIGSPCDEFDTVLIGDMFYDEQFANELFCWLKNLAASGKTVLIGDPGRHAVTAARRKSLRLLAQYKLPENSCLENRGFQETTVWKFVT